DVGLPLLRGVIFGILAEVAELARAFDFLGQLRLELAIERDDLILELSQQLIFHRTGTNRNGRKKSRIVAILARDCARLRPKPLHGSRDMLASGAVADPLRQQPSASSCRAVS